LGQYDKNQSNTDIFRIGPIPVSPITTRSESARNFDNCKEKSREILDWLIILAFHITLTNIFYLALSQSEFPMNNCINVSIIVLLGDVFHIGLDIGLWPAVLA
jgi:hypothetical protein